MTQSNLDRAAIAIAQRVEAAINRAANPTHAPDTIQTQVVKALEEAGFEQKIGDLQTTLLAMQATLEQIQADKGAGSTTKPVAPPPVTTTPAQPQPAGQTSPSKPTVEAVRSLNFFGDSTNARIGDQAKLVARADNLPVINNAQGGSLASYALMSMNGSPVEISFDTDTVPAKAAGDAADVSATLTYGEGVTPFSLHSATVVIDGGIEAMIIGQQTSVKVRPRDSQAHSVTAGQKYKVLLKNNGGTNGICVLATGKNDINGANVGNWQAILERIKTYTKKCLDLVEPKANQRFIVLTNWADNKPSWVKATYTFRHTLKDQYNQWLKATYGRNVYDIEAYMLSEQIWNDVGITPNEADKQAQKEGIMPLSLSFDGGAHFLPAVEAKIAEHIISKAKELGYL